MSFNFAIWRSCSLLKERLASLLLITVVHSTFIPVNVQENTASNMTSLTKLSQEWDQNLKNRILEHKFIFRIMTSRNKTTKNWSEQIVGVSKDKITNENEQTDKLSFLKTHSNSEKSPSLFPRVYADVFLCLLLLTNTHKTQKIFSRQQHDAEESRNLHICSSWKQTFGIFTKKKINVASK